MLDLGTTWLATVARDPEALAIVDGPMRFSYAAWHERVAGMAAGFGAMGLLPGDHIVTLLQTRWEAATVHWAAQLAGLIYTPADWALGERALVALIEDCGASALVYQPEALAARSAPRRVARISLATPMRGEIAFDDLLEEPSIDAVPQVGADGWSTLIYKSVADGDGPVGVPRRHRAQRAAAFAHVAHNQYAPGERLLGTMPLHSEPGLRGLISMALVGGTFICQRDDDPATTAALIEAERVTALHMGSLAFADLITHPECTEVDVRTVGRLGVADMPVAPALAQLLDDRFRPLLFTGTYGCPEIPLCTVNHDVVARPASAGRAGYQQLVRVVSAHAVSAEDQAAPGEVGRVVALINGDDAFEGYWRRPERDRLTLHDGWFLTGDIGYFDVAGALFITGQLPLEPAEEPTTIEAQLVPVMGGVS
jgi:2-furoate---CoA ligase